MAYMYFSGRNCAGSSCFLVHQASSQHMLPNTPFHRIITSSDSSRSHMDADPHKSTRGSDAPGEDCLYHIRGDFVPVSPRAKAQSASPRRRANRQPIDAHVNLVARRMEKLSDT